MRELPQLGRYSLVIELASGGMASVYLGRMSGAAGFGRTVAIKRLHPHLAHDPEFVSSFIDEARLAARIRHPNVVPTLDVVAMDRENFIVMEYVHGESVGGLIRTCRANKQMVPVPVTLSILIGVLSGLHAAHEAKDEQGQPLSIVHRDISPQNVLVGVDGVARVLDFGVAKARVRLLETTQQGRLKGKIPYMAPEQIRGSATRQSDIYAAGIVLWEMLTGRRLFQKDNEVELLEAVLTERVPPPSARNPRVPPEVDRIVQRAIARNPRERYATAREMAEAIDACLDVASAMKVAQWVEATVGPVLSERQALVSEVERLAASPPLVDPADDGKSLQLDTMKMTLEELQWHMGEAAPEPIHPPISTSSPAAEIPPLPLPPSRPHRRRWLWAAGTVLVLLGSGLAIQSWNDPRLPGEGGPPIASRLEPLLPIGAASSPSEHAPEPDASPAASLADAGSSHFTSFETKTSETKPPSPLPALTKLAPSATRPILKTPLEAGTPPLVKAPDPPPSPPPRIKPASSSEGSVADQARGFMIREPDKARGMLETRFKSGRATAEEIQLLKTICRAEHDPECLARCNAALGLE